MTEITFLVHEAEEGGYHAEAAGFGILAEGDTISELKENIKSGISLFYHHKISNGKP
ncbi:2-oxoisovalerate dehydrogenase [uncultured Mucilaginibacter sp.]|uniref:type II toxin-antitoxin system HicB family antitoxin n=1 Tax=uncultured Mucilaginibacter sp. TaxID=797541 RepID=UPI0026361277|nr:2-oxoisovalerate dehydrogenase [uncultured Mucilaginibacter sp.]